MVKVGKNNRLHNEFDGFCRDKRKVPKEWLNAVLIPIPS